MHINTIALVKLYLWTRVILSGINYPVESTKNCNDGQDDGDVICRASA